jgi:hypothetical protein
MIKKILNLFRKKKDNREDINILLDKLFCEISKCEFSIINCIPATLTEQNTTVTSLRKRIEKLYKKSGYHDGSFSNIDYMVRLRTALFTYEAMNKNYICAREIAIMNAMIWVALSKMENEKIRDIIANNPETV